MQLSQIYSNAPKLFSRIQFNLLERADQLNVIYGTVRHPKDRKKDSHNLGKTTLLHLIDFLLLKGTTPDQFLIKNQERFQSFAFFIEIALNSGNFATIRRDAIEPNRIWLTRHDDKGRDYTEAGPDEWDHPNMSRDDAVKLLDGWLDLKILKPYSYRQAITYFLRAQGDYNDELQLQKFAAGKDRFWKPFVAHLFGFDETPVRRKYELDEKIEELRNRQAIQQSEVQFSEDQLPELAARIGNLQQQVQHIEKELDAFRFDSEERKILKDVVESVEGEIAQINERLYNIRYDVRQIDAALSHRDKFDLAEIDEIFHESQVHFGDQIKKQYSDLVDFNKKVTQERNAALRARRKVLEQDEASLSQRKSALDKQRGAQLSVLRSTDTFEKFKSLQREVTNYRATLVYLEEQRKKLESVAETARQVREYERDRGRVVDEIKTLVSKPSVVFEQFRAIFNSYCQRVLNHDAIFFFKVNASNNFDYNIGLALAGQSATASSLSDGTSYRKLLCALFDLALLKVYERAPFFHFVYHDGVLEGLDDRKKLALLEIVSEQTANRTTQYILTLIDSDLPRDSAGRRVNFENDEIVLGLSDEGQDGRLFRMPEF